MRVSSVTAPFSSGTLKSTRMKTRRADRSRSRIDNFIELPPTTNHQLQTFLGHVVQQVDAPVRVAPLVVVPREDFHEVTVHDLRVVNVENRRRWVPAEVDRDERLG